MHDFWHHRLPIRTVDEPADEGGSSQPQEPETGDEDGARTDWQARFEQERKHARLWEERAKSNSKAADELKQLKESQMSEQQKAEKHTKELEAKVAEYEAKQQQAQWRSEVAQQTGVPADLLAGDTKEAMEQMAAKLDGYLHPKPQGAALTDPAKTPNHKAEGQQMKDFVNKLFGNS